MADVGTIRVSDAMVDRVAAARDLWPGGTLDFWQGRALPLPDRVYWPEDTAEVHALLQHASEAGVPVVPYGAGSGVCGGARGRVGAVVLDTKAFADIGPIDTERWEVEAGAGVLGQHLEDALNRQGYTLGHSPSSIWCSTVGGWAAARSAGQFSSRYGVFEDMVTAMQVVTPGRPACWVGEGGDAPGVWMPLLLGSEGTIGVITRVRMRVWPRPKTRWLRGYQFPDVQSAVDGMRRVMQGELWPAVLRLYDPVDTRIGGRTKAKSDGGSAHFTRRWLKKVAELPEVRRHGLSLPLALPGLVNRVFGQLASGCLLIAGWEGEESTVQACSAAGHALLCEQGTDLGPDPGDRWYGSRHHVSYKLAPIFEGGGFADTMEVACRWADLVPMYHAIRQALGKTTVVMAHMSHLYPEGGSIYFSFAGAGDRETYDQTWRAALHACLKSGGTVTHHHGVGSLKAWAAAAEAGPAVRGWRDLKTALDPAAVMNPGRLFEEGAADVAVAPRELDPVDGLVRVPLKATLEERRAAAAELGGELRWPWEDVVGPRRWVRNPWQSAVNSLTGSIDGSPCRLGRGPRSAAGPDLREWAALAADDVEVTVATVSEGPRWLGEGTPQRPWAVAQALLRADLRPAVLTVEDGRLLVGFRGPAAAELGAIAAELVPGGLTPTAWRFVPLASGPLVRCEPDDPGAVAVNMSGVWRRES